MLGGKGRRRDARGERRRERKAGKKKGKGRTEGEAKGKEEGTEGEEGRRKKVKDGEREEEQTGQGPKNS